MDYVMKMTDSYEVLHYRQFRAIPIKALFKILNVCQNGWKAVFLRDSLRHIAYFLSQSSLMIYGEFPFYETFIKYNKTEVLKT